MMPLPLGEHKHDPNTDLIESCQTSDRTLAFTISLHVWMGGLGSCPGLMHMPCVAIA